METSPVFISPIQPGRVLIVDDDAKSRQLLKDLLTASGHVIVEAADGEEGLAAVRLCVPDVILLDVVMPKMDGFEVCRRLKGDPATALIHILMITSLSDREYRVKGIKCGANDFLTKPVEREEVLLRVRNAIQAKQVMDELQLRRSEETLDDTLLRQLGGLSIANTGLAVGLLSIGVKMLLSRLAAGRLEDSERERLYAVYEQIAVALAKSGPPPA